MSERETWIDRLQRRVARWCEQGLGKTWVVAVSGGGDSVGLLRVLHQLAGPLGLRLSVAPPRSWRAGRCGACRRRIRGGTGSVTRFAVCAGHMAANAQRAF